MFSSKIYESWHSLQNEKYAFLLEKFPDFFSGVVLDIGCGNNFLKQFLKARNIKTVIIGLDISGGDIMADASNLPFADASFEKIICVDAIHLFDNDFTRILKKNGLALVSMFFNDGNYEDRKKLLKSKLNGLTITGEFVFAGREKEFFVLAKK